MLGLQGGGIAALLAAAIIALAGGGASASADPVFGYWLTENRRAIVEIRPCGVSVCGRLAWVAGHAGGERGMQAGPDEGAGPGAELCGQRLIGAFRQSRPGSWEDGYIRDPRDGARYSAWLEVKSRDRLEVRGYLGISLLGRSQTWTRATGDRGGC